MLDDERSGPEFRLRNLVLGTFDLVASQIGHDGALVIGKVRIPFVTAIALPFAFGQLQTRRCNELHSISYLINGEIIHSKSEP